MHIAIALLVSYLLGSIPFPYLLVRASTGRDLRTSGNGNVGARNAIAVAGSRVGIGALLLDAIKGAASFGVALLLGGERITVMVAALGVVLGHWFPIWLGWRGGVGQAAISGFLVVMWPLPGLLGIALFGLGRLLFRPFNLAYALAALGYVLCGYWLHRSWSDVGFVLLLMVLMIAKKLIDMPRQQRIRAAQATPADIEHEPVGE